MLPTDMALIEDEKFLPYVKKCTSLSPSFPFYPCVPREREQGLSRWAWCPNLYENLH